MEVSVSKWHYYLTVHVADRPDSLSALLESFRTQVKLYPGDRKITLMVFDDSKNQTAIRERIMPLISRNTEDVLSIEYWDSERQYIFLKQHYTQEQLTSYKSFIGEVPSEARLWFRRSIRMHNIIRLILQKQIDSDRKNIICGQLDSDLLFGMIQLSPEGQWKIATNSFDFFSGVESYFEKPDIQCISSMYVMDPPYCFTYMCRTVLVDMIHFFSHLKRNAYLPHEQYVMDEIKKKDLFFSQYNFSDFQCNKISKYSCKVTAHKAAEKKKFLFRSYSGNTRVEEILREYATHIHYFIFGHHPTRPILSRDENLFWDMVQFVPGYSFYRPRCLPYLLPFADIEMRMHGPIYGFFLTLLPDASTFKCVNLPMIHKRVVWSTDRQQQGYRTGIEFLGEKIEIKTLSQMQIRGEVIHGLLYLLRKKFKRIYYIEIDQIGKMRFKKLVANLFEKSLMTVHDRYKINARLIRQNIRSLERTNYLYSTGYWWNAKQHVLDMEPFRDTYNTIKYIWGETHYMNTCFDEVRLWWQHTENHFIECFRATVSWYLKTVKD